MGMTKRASLAQSIQTFMDEIDGMSKAAGSGQDTSHPTGKADDGTQSVALGERANENKSDVKEQIGESSIDSTSVGAVTGDKSLNIGLRQSATGEDPASETITKDKSDDSGTEHPARADSEKYSAMSLDALCKAASVLGNALLSEVATQQIQSSAAGSRAAGLTVTKEGAASGSSGTDAGAADLTTAKDAEKAAAAGYELAAILGNGGAAPAPQEFIAETIKSAEAAATEVATFIHAYQAEKQAAQKRAEEEEEPVPTEARPRKEPPEEAVPAEAVPAEAAAPGGDALSQMMAGGMPGSEAGGMPGSEAGGMPGGEAGGMPPGMPPGMPGDAAGGMAPGGQGDEAAMAELEAVLAELGITPEQLLAAVTSKAASAVSRKAKTAATPSTRDLLKSHIREIVGRPAA